MTHDDVLRMAREAGFSSAVGKHIGLDDDLERFAAQVALAEREACAKVCDKLWSAAECAEAIRARSNP